MWLSDAYIVVTREITVVKKLFSIANFVAPNNTQANNTQAIVAGTNSVNTNNVIDGKSAFKNSAPFISCVSKINNVLIDWLIIDLNVVMPIYNLIEYSKNYSKTTGSLQNYYRDEPDSKQNVKIIVPLRYLSNFWKTCDITFINCEISLV